jgi:hypothetical protein
MATIGEASKEYKSSATQNIATLTKVSTKLELVSDSFEIEDNITHLIKKVNQEVVVIEDIKYRVPVSVKQQLKVLLEDNPGLEFFKVKKTGTTKDDTRYQVIPLMS